MSSVNRSIITVLFLIFVLCGVSTADEILYARYPTLSPDNATIAFTYQGDIWTVPTTGGMATRLTVHEAEDIQPQFSPDGRWIVFSSRRFGNYDVYVMLATGGKAEQLTFHSSSDIASGWFPGSDSLLFTSTRNGRRDIYKVSIDGGMPTKMAGTSQEHLYNGRIIDDGRSLLYNSGSGLSRWWRRDLRSSRNADIFIQDRLADGFQSRRLTNWIGHDVWPILNPIREELYFVSCRGDWAQLYRIPSSGGDPEPLTEFVDDGVQWLGSNPGGTMLVFEQGFHLWIMDPEDAQPRQLAIFINSGERENLVDYKNLGSNVEWFQLSPDDKKIAAVIHGEIYLLPAEEPEAPVRLTRTSARERFVHWGSDSRTLYYASDRNGDYDIFSFDAVTGEEVQLTDDPADETKPLCSPDGKYLIYYRGLDKIIRHEISSERAEVWVSGPFLDFGVEPTQEYSWSLDSKWLAFSMGGPTFEIDIYLTNLDGEVFNVSQYVAWCYRPRFSHDGKQVYYSNSNRWGKGTFKTELVQKPVGFFETAIDSLFLDSSSVQKEVDSDDEKQVVPEPVILDTARIVQRRSQLFGVDVSTEYPVLTADGKKYLFVASILGEPEIWVVNTEDDPDLTQLTHSGKAKSQLALTSDSKSVIYLEGGKIKRCSIEKGKAESLDFSVQLEVDRLQNNRQKFRESWQMLNSYFYDSTYHGTDWSAVHDKYRPVVEHIRTSEEFRNLEMELMGELRASHLYIYSNDSGPATSVATGYLGVEFDQSIIEREGHFRVAHVYRDSPADRAGIMVGQYLKSIDTTQLGKSVNLSTLLAGTIGSRVSVTVADKADGKGAVMTIKPVSGGRMYDLRYEDWVESNRQVVDSLSGGRLAYLHIRSMNKTSMKRFEEELVSLAESKQGAIVDVRFNGGGWTAVHILGELMKSPYIMRTFRGQPATSENKMRSKAFEKPMTLLINNSSGSNAEIFAEGFRRLKLGKIIGTPTSGAVIGTSSYYLIDGTRIKRPSWGAFTADMEDTDLQGRQPDILVENLPDDYISGRDRQLARAVEELITEL